MASAAPRPLRHTARLALRAHQTARPRSRIPLLLPHVASRSSRWLSDAAPSNAEADAADTVGKALGELGPAETEPRWRYTPPAMKAPFPIDKRTERIEFKVNEDMAVLDGFYARFLGSQWPKMLPEELKWLAVTHKSFDQGRRGFNDRLAYFGRQAIILEVTKNIITSPATPDLISDPYERVPFQHPSLAGLENLNTSLPIDVFSKEKVYRLALSVHMPQVLRWRPKNRNNLANSGLSSVLNGAVQAIVGAIYLQHGAAVASSVLKERILDRLERG